MNKDDFIKMMENGYNSLVREETLEEKSFRVGYEYAVDKMFYIVMKSDKEIERLKSNEKTLADLLDKEQKKNKKAIEYIKENKIEGIDDDGYSDAWFDYVYVRDLLDILKGEDTK